MSIFLQRNKTRHYSSKSYRKCAIVERFNLTIQNILYRMMAENKSYEWVKMLDNALNIYRKRKHRTIKMSPNEGELSKNENIVRKNLLNFFHNRGLTRNKFKFSIGEKVRINKIRDAFHRGYSEENTMEYMILME